MSEWGVNLSPYPSFLLHFYPVGSLMQHKKVRVLSCILLKKTLPLQPDSLPPLDKIPPHSYIMKAQSYIVLASILEDCQSWTHNLCTLRWFSLTSRPSMVVQLVSVCLYEEYLLKLTPQKKITPSLLHHVTPLAAQFIHYLTPSEQINPSLIQNFSPEGSFLRGHPIAAHCSPLLHSNFSQGVIPQKSSHYSKLQLTLTWQF